MSDALDIRKIRPRPAAQQRPAMQAAEGAGGFWDFLNKDISLSRNRLPDRVKENFYLELSSLLEAGVDIRTALELARDEQKKKKVRAVFEGVLNKVVRGATLSAALKSAGKFTAYEFFSVQIGEETGKLVQVLKELAVYFNKKIRQRRQITGAITYPVLVLVVAFAAVSFMLTYVVPMFADTFRRFGSDLPAITQMVIAASAFIKKYIGVFFLVMAGVVVVCWWQRNNEWFRRWSSALLMRVPVVGVLVQKIYLARFCNTLALLVASRIPIVQAIRLTRQMITFYPVESSLQSIEERVIGGTPLNKALSEFSIYPAKMVSMVKVGEEVNQLEMFFGRLADQYANEVEYQTTLLSKFLEPLIIVVLGLVVGVILIAMYLPLFKLGQAF
ncbi:MAG TPA: type II secretion system F family protein [Chitinophagaceae bacterium]|nr:type II secretion system F family protein [Chitinophagaceae bacterium]